jgi:hypothetical protein
MTMTRIFLVGFASAAVAWAYSGDSFAAKFEAMPAAAQATASANMENALPVSITSTKGRNGMEYQVNTKLFGEMHNLVIDEKGKLLAVKDGTDLASIPAAAKAAIQKEGASSSIVNVEKVTEGDLVSYGAVMKDAEPGKYVHVRVAADGTVKTKTVQTTDR